MVSTRMFSWAGVATLATLLVLAAHAAARPPRGVGGHGSRPSSSPLDPDAGASASPTVPSEARFAYRTSRRIQGTAGSYVGYSDLLSSTGTYDITRSETELQLHARYTWRYDGETPDDGSEDRQVRVGLPSRVYVGRTDLDDYDSTPGPLATWVWIDPTTPTGSAVRILDREFIVQWASPRAQLDTLGTSARDEALRREFERVLRPHDGGLRLIATTRGTSARNDAYGRFTTTFEDRYEFDPVTGYVLSATYRESDRGFDTEGGAASFELVETMTVTSATYLGDGRVEDPVPPAPHPYRSATRGEHSNTVPLLLAALFALAALVAVVLVFGRVKTPNTLARVLPVTPGAALPATKHLGPFAQHFAQVARQMGGRVVGITDASGQRLRAAAIDDPDTAVPTILATEPDDCEDLRRTLGRDDFFTEVQHKSLPRVKDPSKPAYNTAETYTVMHLELREAPTYDPDVVQRLGAENTADRAAVLQLLDSVYGSPPARWFDAAIACGEIPFIAKIDGKVVGCAMLTVLGDQARLATNTVSTDSRNRGIGKELMRARLAAAHALGATRAMVEIATWNHASLAVARSLGFQETGQLWVATARPAAPPKHATRR